MKKLISLALALVMILSLATVAFADTTATKTFKLKKAYTTDVEGIYPNEVLTFTATSTNADAPTVTFETLNPTNTTLEEDTDGNKYFAVNGTVSGVTTAGEWHYTVKETGVSAQGASVTDDDVELTVIATWNDNDGLDIVVGPEKDGEYKDDGTFKNDYDLGTLTVKKEVSGNLGDKKNQEFTIRVTFNSTAPVKSAITYGDNTIGTDAWTEVKNGEDVTGYTAEASITLKHDAIMTFANIPAGVTYKVEEDDSHIRKNDEALDPNNYATGYTVTYTDQKGTIATRETAKAVVKNSKNNEAGTGIVLDSMPYIILLTLAAAGMFVLLTKKRAREF